MAALQETEAPVDVNNDWADSGIYQLEQTDLVLGGPGGIDNLQAEQLLARINRVKSMLLGLNVSAFIRTLLDDADAATARATLGAATQADINTAIANLVASSPAALDTLNELAAALGNDANFATTITNALALKAALASPVFTGNPQAPTPAQFDNDTSLATTEFVKRAGLQSSGITVISTSIAVPISAIGGEVLLNAASAIAPTLPLANSVPAGTRLHFRNVNTGTASLTASGADNIVTGTGAAGTSIPIKQADDLVLESNGATYWYIVAGSASLPYSSNFGASLTTSGYQKLPSGLIIQWSTLTTSASADINWTFPIAFPNAMLFATGVVISGSTSNPRFVSMSSSYGNTLIPVSVYNAAAAGARVADNCLVFAIGR